MPFYNIDAYKDPQAITSYQSENELHLQITDVQATGHYAITGSYKEEFTSHALFTLKQPDGTYKWYVNKVNPVSFVVEITEMIPLREWSFSGIKGSFYGTLYNESNPLDSLVIQKGEFTLWKINWYNFNQCAQ